MSTPEAVARQHIDELLAACGWIVQDRAALNLYAGRGVAVLLDCGKRSSSWRLRAGWWGKGPLIEMAS